jgi:membrane protease YdiL (CAAX protease family)
VVWFGLLALVLTLVVDGVWAALLGTNLRVSPSIPWSVGVMALLLWLLWQYLGGRGWPHRTAEVRRRSLRARRVSGPVFVWAVAAGVLSIAALAGFWIVLHELVRLPTNPLPNYARYPIVTVALVLIMASLLGAVIEEASFRGYFQGTLEGVVGGVAAIGIVALVMAPVHSSTQGFVWSTIIFYLLVDIMLGTLAYLSRSILPGVVVHFVGLLTFFTVVWPGDASRRLVSQSGTDVWFWLNVGQTIIFAILAFVAFHRLANEAKAMPQQLAGARGA